MRKNKEVKEMKLEKGEGNMGIMYLNSAEFFKLHVAFSCMMNDLLLPKSIIPQERMRELTELTSEIINDLVKNKKIENTDELIFIAENILMNVLITQVNGFCERMKGKVKQEKVLSNAINNMFTMVLLESLKVADDPVIKLASEYVFGKRVYDIVDDEEEGFMYE